MQVAITGSNGFIGKNLRTKLAERNIKYCTISHSESVSKIKDKINESDFLIHLAGVNRPKSNLEFKSGNENFTKDICKIIKELKSNISIIFSSSTQVENENDYGVSKKNCEKLLLDLNNINKNNIFIYRLPNVFGKWGRPNYNSVVATFCHNTSRNIDSRIDNPNSELNLVYIDDVISQFLDVINHNLKDGKYSLPKIVNQYFLTVGELMDCIKKIRDSRENLVIENVGSGLLRALYATYLSYLPTNIFSYNLKSNEDDRGKFVEFLKTKKSGQFSFFTAYPGVTRGAHYHHTKTEKFLIIKGEARFNFKNIDTQESLQIFTSDKELKVIETIPGWFHDITNTGKDLLIVLLWGSEIFDPENPDTYTL